MEHYFLPLSADLAPAEAYTAYQIGFQIQRGLGSWKVQPHCLLFSVGGDYPALRRAFYRLAAPTVPLLDAGVLIPEPRLWPDLLHWARSRNICLLGLGREAEAWLEAWAKVCGRSEAFGAWFTPSASASDFRPAMLKHLDLGVRWRVLGSQGHYEDPALLSFWQKKQVYNLRLGNIRTDGLASVEPLLRPCQGVWVELQSLRRSEVPELHEAGVNGWYGEEFCQLMRYAGMGEAQSLWLNPGSLGEHAEQAAEQAAQGLWYFVAGQQSYPPFESREALLEFHVVLDKGDTHELQFYKSPSSERWCFALPQAPQTLLPCRYEDYRLATQGEISDALMLKMLWGH